ACPAPRSGGGGEGRRENVSPLPSPVFLGYPPYSRRYIGRMTDPRTPYVPAEIEAKWQAHWQEQRSNEPDLAHARRPFYNLMMFPYPSAEGLHVGNLFAFTGADVFGRFKRMQGFDVFEPMGFDAFGI